MYKNVYEYNGNVNIRLQWLKKITKNKKIGLTNDNNVVYYKGKRNKLKVLLCQIIGNRDMGGDINGYLSVCVYFTNLST